MVLFLFTGKNSKDRRERAALSFRFAVTFDGPIPLIVTNETFLLYFIFPCKEKTIQLTGKFQMKSLMLKETKSEEASRMLQIGMQFKRLRLKKIID